MWTPTVQEASDRRLGTLSVSDALTDLVVWIRSRRAAKRPRAPTRVICACASRLPLPAPPAACGAPRRRARRRDADPPRGVAGDANSDRRRPCAVTCVQVVAAPARASLSCSRWSATRHGGLTPLNRAFASCSLACLVRTENQKVFNIFRHIESCGICMKH